MDSCALTGPARKAMSFEACQINGDETMKYVHRLTPLKC
ncbi:hypothetical protein [Sideroxydans sp. CL21]|nr:hypothetical protein [Sideroxydans sp. CL21]